MRNNVAEISSLWVGGKLSWLEQLSLMSWVRSGHTVRLYSYETLQVPSGVILCEASDIVTREQVFQNPTSTSFAGFSNVFRYHLMVKRPQEIWVDTDMVAGSTPLRSAPYIYGFESKNVINGAIFRAPHDSSLTAELIEKSEEIDKAAFRWGELGPKLVTRSVQNNNLAALARDKSVFYEIDALEAWKFFSSNHAQEIRLRTLKSEGIHIWNEALKLANFPVRQKTPQAGSFLADKLKQFGLFPNDLTPISEKELRAWKKVCGHQRFRNQIYKLGSSVGLFR
jgi:hypothetical protein